MANKVSIWLTEELKRRGWSIRELARRSKVSHPVIADMINLDHQPKVRIYKSIAKALEIDEEWFLRLADISPAVPSTDTPIIKEMSHDFAYLTTEEQEVWLKMLRSFVAERKPKYCAEPPPDSPGKEA